ncbi:uncharacterized protein [Pempheris klunzingeri]|uniref:uncharacterized protein n=1 Tax=Pempheris klunzingeri TaxID=3127111 RepID=UPI00397F18C3
MTGTKSLMRVLLLTSLLLTGVSCEKDATFLYHRLGDEAFLPCTNLDSPYCSSIKWTFYQTSSLSTLYENTDVVSEGRVRADSPMSSRLSVTSNCSLSLRDLTVNDAGSFICMNHGKTIAYVYLSLLTITSLSTINDLQPGGNLSLSCVLFTFYDTGSCNSYSSFLMLSWVAEDGTSLPQNSRLKLTDHTRCSTTLTIRLLKEDNNRKWRCQVKTSENSTLVSQDFTSRFLFENPPTDLNLIPSATTNCKVQLPISRIVLCVALPVMVFIVGFFTWRGDRERAKTSAAGFELQEIK